MDHFEEEEEELLLTTAMVCCIQTKTENESEQKRKWCKGWISEREKWSHKNLIERLRSEPADFRNYMRMDETTYVELLNLVTPLLSKQDTVMRLAITPHEKLSATLRFLSTGTTYTDMKYRACMSKASLSHIIPETCAAIFSQLKNEYMKVCNFIEILILFLNFIVYLYRKNATYLLLIFSWL